MILASSPRGDTHISTFCSGANYLSFNPSTPFPIRVDRTKLLYVVPLAFDIGNYSHRLGHIKATPPKIDDIPTCAQVWCDFDERWLETINSEPVCECRASNAHPRDEYRFVCWLGCCVTSHGVSYIVNIYARASEVRRRHFDHRQAAGSYVGRPASHAHDHCEAFRRFTVGKFSRFCTNPSARSHQGVGTGEIPCCTNQTAYLAVGKVACVISRSRTLDTSA